MAPMSCSTSSANMVVERIRESAKAWSFGLARSRWWAEASMSMCSATVFTVYGRVGFVEAGNTFSLAATFRMSGACPPCGALRVEDVDAASVDGIEGGLAGRPR